MFDLDHFKKVNDTYGHLAGDFILVEVSKIIKGQLRDSDIFGRIGGEEFMILLAHTKKDDSLKVTNKLLKLISNYQFIYNDQIIPITISIGITSVLNDDTYLSIVNRVDKALYKAKQNGRNKIEYL
jgi:diguanylate cyclase (GGDEF)-like protein